MQTQLRIEHLREKKAFFEKPELELEWIVSEGKMVLSFLHLEDSHEVSGFNSLLCNNVETNDNEEILGEIHDFYHALYSCRETPSNLNKFLESIPSLPKVVGDCTPLTNSITTNEIESAIKKLRLNKSPGCDGLTAEFYQHFIQELAPILCEVFNKIFEDKRLTDTQKIAIIVLIFKKGDNRLLGNYRPILLTNANYKILAYILLQRLEEHLPFLISPQQTAYMKSHFIGTNIRFI